MNIDKEAILQRLGDGDLRDQFSIYLKESDNIDLSLFVEEVDQSDYSLTDWADALVGFDQWLAAERSHFKSRDFSDMIGYMHCCQMTLSDHLSKPNLRDVVVKCLEEFGYDSSQ